MEYVSLILSLQWRMYVKHSEQHNYYIGNELVKGLAIQGKVLWLNQVIEGATAGHLEGAKKCKGEGNGPLQTCTVSTVHYHKKFSCRMLRPSTM